MAFTNPHQVLLVLDEHKASRYIVEADVSKIYATPAHALENVDYDTALAFVIMDVSQNFTTRDVSEQMAKAYVDKFEPDLHEHVPPFVEESEAYQNHIEELEAYENRRRPHFISMRDQRLLLEGRD